MDWPPTLTLTLVVCVPALAAVAGVVVTLLVARAKRRRHWARLHALGQELLRDGNAWESLLFFSEAFGIRPHHQTKGGIGACLESLGQTALAAQAYHEAWRCATPPLGAETSNAWMAFYAWAEASARARSGNWEFAFLRANEGLAYLRRCEAAVVVEEGELESELHVMRMIASLHHLRGSQAVESSREDARWIVERSKVERHKEIALSLLGTLDMAGSAKFELEQAWKQYLRRNWRIRPGGPSFANAKGGGTMIGPSERFQGRCISALRPLLVHRSLVTAKKRRHQRRLFTLERMTQRRCTTLPP